MILEIIEQTGDLIEGAAAGIMNGMIEFVKWIFGSGFEKLSSLNIVKKSTANFSQSAGEINDSFKNGLEEKTPSIIEFQTAGILESLKNTWSVIKIMANTSPKN
jgi:hypothetical protein